MDKIFKKDATRFKEYIQSTTVHGIVHVFIGKSYIRKAFWFVIMLAAATACTYNCADRIRFFISKPTTTSITLQRRREIDFPAVTICNLNMLRREYLEKFGLDDLVRDILLFEYNVTDTCVNTLNGITNLPNMTYQRLMEEGRDKLQSFIVGCQYLGRDCTIDYHNFVPTLTRLGVCYTFNSGYSGSPVLKTDGTGSRLGLKLMVNVSQGQYVASANLDAGVKIAIHHQSEPPQPDDLGIGIPTGRNAFIGVKQYNIIDETMHDCTSPGDVSGFNFLRGEFNYSFSACSIDCFYSQIAGTCGCIVADEFLPDNSSLKSLPFCTVRDLCCVLVQQAIAVSCSCRPSCRTAWYDTTNSYSFFPANYYASGRSADLGNDLLTANVYFETLSTREERTSNSYNAVSLLSDIGGQFGLFLGISFISLIEFMTWIVDELKDRCFGISEERIKQLCSRWRTERSADDKEDTKVGDGHGNYEMIQ